MFIVTLRATSPRLCAVGISIRMSGWDAWNFNALCRMTICYEAWPMRNCSLSQSLRGAPHAPGSRFTFCLVFVTWIWQAICNTAFQYQRADTFRLSEKEWLEKKKNDRRKPNCTFPPNCIKVREIQKAVSHLPWDWEDAVDDRILGVLSWLDIHIP